MGTDRKGKEKRKGMGREDRKRRKEKRGEVV